MAKPRRTRRKKRLGLWLGIPIAASSGLLAFIADNPLAAAIVGAVVGLFIGIALIAFPNLDRGGPADTDDLIVH